MLTLIHRVRCRLTGRCGAVLVAHWGVFTHTCTQAVGDHGSRHTCHCGNNW